MEGRQDAEWALASVLRELRATAEFERKRSLSALTF